jgi:hypothetical protein
MFPVPVVAIEARGEDLVAMRAGEPYDVLVPQGGGAFLSRRLWSRVTFDPPVDGRSRGFEVQPLYRPGSYRGEREEGARP